MNLSSFIPHFLFTSAGGPSLPPHSSLHFSGPSNEPGNRPPEPRCRDLSSLQARRQPKTAIVFCSGGPRQLCRSRHNALHKLRRATMNPGRSQQQHTVYRNKPQDGVGTSGMPYKASRRHKMGKLAKPGLTFTTHARRLELIAQEGGIS